MPTAAASLRAISLDLAPIEVAARCRHLPDLAFFDTSLESGAPGEISIVAANPCRVIQGHTDSDWTALQAALAEHRRIGRCDDGLPHGFAAGFVEYDGAFRFGFYEDALIHRHADQSWSELGDLCSRLAGPASAPPTPRPKFAPTLDRERFCGMVARAHDYIAAGDIYQVNLAHRFTAPWQCAAFQGTGVCRTSKLSGCRVVPPPSGCRPLCPRSPAIHWPGSSPQRCLHRRENARFRAPRRLCVWRC